MSWFNIAPTYCRQRIRKKPQDQKMELEGSVKETRIVERELFAYAQMGCGQ
jgi:hypothetical protein